MNKPYRRSRDIGYILTEAIRFIAIVAVIGFILVLVITLIAVLGFAMWDFWSTIFSGVDPFAAEVYYVE